MSAAENKSLGSCQKEGSDAPPPLEIELPMLSELPKKSKSWRDDQLPVDILLLTVEDCEFLACYAYVRNSVKRYHKDLGCVYFGSVGDDDDEPLKIALLKCSKEEPNGAQTVVKNAVMKLRPKVIYSVGCCEGLKPENTQLGDVVVSSKLITETLQIPVGRNIANLIKNCGDGWIPPLKKPYAHQVHVHRDGEILSCMDKKTAKQYPGAIALVMEGKGIFVAAHDLKMEWVIVKGVSHFADSNKTPNESWESHACVMAASLVFNMLNDTVVFKQWPHYKDEDSRERTRKDPLSEEVNSASQLKRVLSCSSLPDAKRTKDLDDFSLEKCQERLKSKYNDISKVTIIPWDRINVVHIDSIYTQLSWVKNDVKPRGVVKTRLKDYTEIFTSKGQRNPKRILVYGRPGIGKSTFCKKAAYDWSQKSKQISTKFDLVLLIKLQDVCNLHDVSAILRASELLANDSNISVDSLDKYIRDHQDKVLLILDGFDEYSCDIKESPIRRIWETTILSECTVLLTMRQTNELKSSLWFEINGFDSEDQVKMFSQNFLDDKSVVNEFYEYLEKQDLKEIAEFPLLLSMLCVLWEEKVLERDSASRANIYTNFIQTMRVHSSEKEDAKPFEFIKEEELFKSGKLAYNALLKGNLILLKRELTHDLQIIINKFIKVGLCHSFKPSRVDPEEGTSFIHKSFQEYFAGMYLKELVISRNDKMENFLSELDSLEKILKIREVLTFASELSECSACAILNHLGRVAKDEGLTATLETMIATETPSWTDVDRKKNLPEYLWFTTHIFLCCPAETRANLFPTFLSCTGSVLLINSDQLHCIAKQHLLRSTGPPNLIFLPDEPSKHLERDYEDLISVMEDLNAVVVSSSGVKNASLFLKKYPVRPVCEFFLKKEKNMHLYFAFVDDYAITHGSHLYHFPTEMLKELIASPESAAQQRKKSDFHQSSDQNSRTAVCLPQDTDNTFVPTHHCLSLVWAIYATDLSNEAEIQVLTEVMTLVVAPREIHLSSKTLKLIRSYNFTERLDRLSLCDCSIDDVSATISTFLHQSPNLHALFLSENSLGEGVSVLTSLLSCVPHLHMLFLSDVMMTKQQVHDLTTAVRQSEICALFSEYHDREGNPLPEDEWPSEDHWEERPWLVPSESESEDELGSSAESEDERGSSDKSQEKDLERNLNKPGPSYLDELFEVLKEMGEYSSDEEKPMVID